MYTEVPYLPDDFAAKSVYKMCMNEMIDQIAVSRALERIDLGTLSQRLEIARIRKFDSRTAAVEAMNAPGEINLPPRTYQSHEAGDRKPKMGALWRYCDVFDVPIRYILFGEHAHIYEMEARAQARRIGVKLKIDQTDDDSEPRPAPINHATELTKVNSSHNMPPRFIRLLSAKEIRDLNTGRGDLTQMSGQLLPVPPDVTLGRHSFFYKIPPHDHSMIAKEGLSLGPGSVVSVDLEQKIFPGNYVLADLAGYDEPIVRIYKAARPYTSGVPFSLEALNPAFEPIHISAPSECLRLARICSSTTPL
jgi:hypothetical protein